MGFFDIDDIEKEMRRMQERMNKIFDALRRPRVSEVEFRRPFSEMRETSNEIIMSFELPGVEKKDIALEVTENRIKVKAQKKKAEEVKKKDFYQARKEAGTFYYEETLPAKVIPEKAEAEFKNGVLRVRLPKKEKVKVKVKRVKVK